MINENASGQTPKTLGASNIEYLEGEEIDGATLLWQARENLWRPYYVSEAQPFEAVVQGPDGQSRTKNL